MKRSVIFRANGSEQLGLGHIVRCLALVNMLGNEFNCLFIVNKPGNRIIEMIAGSCALHDLNTDNPGEELEKLRSLLSQDDVLVLDGYSFDYTYQISVKYLVRKLVIIDDMADRAFLADAIINHGDISVLPEYQIVKGKTEVYSGFEYLIVRKEFLIAAASAKVISGIKTAFVCMGGSDPFNITEKVLEACLQCSFLEKIIVVTGGLYSRKEDLRKMIGDYKTVNIQHVENAGASEMVSYINESQIAISTASSIALEICCVKSPLLCGMVVDNQFSIHSLLLKNGCCISIGDWRKATVQMIQHELTKMNDLSFAFSMIDAQSAAVDGRSGERISHIFNMLAA